MRLWDWYMSFSSALICAKCSSLLCDSCPTALYASSQYDCINVVSISYAVHLSDLQILHYFPIDLPRCLIESHLPCPVRLLVRPSLPSLMAVALSSSQPSLHPLKSCLLLTETTAAN